ncbi:hypothetical protein D9757_007539 [Collybiopsis confluens]|uniref:NADPH-dependent diflavin oxidoreductase 1 n=1 Tax=Collybiopsis confluens TaxID=2823264 RepID=A0A8H5HF95_9AGAR|nr:hypothetical protein D9757_007539 [Collybiopsis confluens]
MSDRTALVLYATETGNAQETGDRVARECRRIHLQCQALSTDAYSLKDLVSETLVVFVVATTGSGIEPRSMTVLWNMLLRSDLPEDLFEDLHFAVFGLGDTTYEKFCWPAKRLARRLESLGATKICPIGEGDEQHLLGSVPRTISIIVQHSSDTRIDGALEPWLESLSSSLLELLPLPPAQEIISPEATPPARVSLVRPSDPQVTPIDPLRHHHAYHTVTFKSDARITAQGWFQDVRHLEFEFEFGDDFEYAPGDVAVIHPIATADEVESFLSSRGWGNSADDVLEIEHVYKDQSLPDHLPRFTSLRTIFTRYLDFNAVPRRTFFRYLRYFTSDDTERGRLDEFLSAEYAASVSVLLARVEADIPHQDELYDYCYRVRRTIQEVLSEFRNVQIPVDYIFDMFPPLRPRQFSIASSIKKHPRSIHLCVAMVNYKTKLKIARRGVCSMYLSQLVPGQQLQIRVLKGFIRLPPDSHTPIICVGPGTGIAPMRAVIEERIHSQAHENTLYFGCRSANKDQHYASEWKQYSADHALTYRVACSRDGPDGVKRTYVQDLIAEDAARIWELLDERNASSNKMPTAVKGALQHAVAKYGSRTEEEALRYILDLERTGRLIEECWS